MLAFLHPAAQGIRINAVMTTEAEHRGGGTWLARRFPHAAKLSRLAFPARGQISRSEKFEMCPLSHQGAGEFSRKLFRNGAASKTPEQVITFVVIVSVREVGHPNAALIVKGVHRI